MTPMDSVPCPKKCGDCMFVALLQCAERHRNPEYYQVWRLAEEMYP